MIERYEQRAAQHAAARDVEARLSRRISRLRLATFIPGLALVILAASRDAAPVPLWAGIVLLAAFAVLVVWHARVDDRVAWFDALHHVNVLALARIGRAWDRLPVAPSPPVDLEHHPYAADLDLFGRASLMQWLGPLATLAGIDTMQRWLLAPGPAAAARARQDAAAVLAPAAEWREQLAAHGRLIAGVRRAELDRFLLWSESAGAFTNARLRLLRAAVVTITASIWLLIAVHAAGIVAGAYWLVPIVAGMVLSFATAVHVHGEFNRAGAGEHAFSRYADLFAHATDAPAGSALLGDIQSRLAASGTAAPEAMRRFYRILGFASLRESIALLHFIVQALTLWDFYAFFALDAWRRRAGRAVRGWMDAVGELDALSAFAQIRADNPSWAAPALVEGDPPADRLFAAASLGHPLIPDDRRVANDVSVGPAGTLLLITGSNMSGKSTLLRAIGLNAVLAQAGAPVCAASLRMPPLDLETSIRVQDSLEHGLSYFMAALARLKGVIARSQHPREGRTVMYLLDEILQGTNTVERAVAVRGVARHLLNAGAIGVMTTHDLALASEEPLNTAARLVHFTEIVDEHGHMTFDYRLRPGLATSRNALRLMELIGIHLQRH